MEAFDQLEVSGIAGTQMADTLSFEVARWLVRRAPRQVEADWKDYSEERAMAATWPRWIPLLEEDAYVEANIPWLRDRKSTRLNSSHMSISYAVFCLKKKK